MSLKLLGFSSLVLLLTVLGSALPAIDLTSFFRRNEKDLEQKFQAWLEEGRELRERRLFEEALALFNRILDLDPLNEEATYEMAETYYKARRWPEALDWYYALGLLAPDRREAFPKWWTAALKMSQGDSLLLQSARLTVRQEMANFLREFPWDWETLAAAREGALVIEDNLLARELTERILSNFPDTPGGYSIISERFYDGLYPIWNDPAQRIPYLRGFLAEHPKSEFRETAWMYLVSALNENGDTLSLRQALAEWIADDPENPLPYERYVRYGLERGVSADSLLPVAREAVNLGRLWRGQPQKHVEQRLMEGKSLYAATRLNMARVLLALERRVEARLWLQDGLRHSSFGVDDEGTLAPFYYYLGVLAEREQSWEEAFDQYTKALIEGEVRPVWTSRADSVLLRIYQEHFADSTSDCRSLARDRQGYAGPVFDDVTDSLGLGGVAAGRVAWGEANGDGYDDLLLGGCRLFLNRGGEKFVEITEQSGLRADGVTGGVWADADLDGDLDLFCAANGSGAAADRLYINQGNNGAGIPHFREAVEFAPVIADEYPSEGAAWGDLQGDGRPDLYVANYEKSGPELGLGSPDFLYLNLPDPGSALGLRFQRLGPDSGLAPPFGENLCGRGVNWGDFDGDGDQDIYVSNYRLQENFLWENAGEALKDQACFYGIAGQERDGWWGHTIGSEWGDFDNDGDLDLITANLAHPRYIEFSNRTCLYENRLRQEGTFKEVHSLWGIKYEETHSDPAWGDVDGDGDLDLYITSIYPSRRSYLYLNDLPERRFREVTYLAGARMSNAWGGAFSDFDQDGDLDLIVGSSEGVRLFRNRGTGHHWLEVEVALPGSGYGTRLLLQQGEKSQLREIQGGKGTTSQHSHRAYFGLGSDSEPVNLEIRFPDGSKVKRKKVALDQKVVILPP